MFIWWLDHKSCWLIDSQRQVWTSSCFATHNWAYYVGHNCCLHVLPTWFYQVRQAVWCCISATKSLHGKEADSCSLHNDQDKWPKIASTDNYCPQRYDCTENIQKWDHAIFLIEKDLCVIWWSIIEWHTRQEATTCQTEIEIKACGWDQDKWQTCQGCKQEQAATYQENHHPFVIWNREVSSFWFYNFEGTCAKGFQFAVNFIFNLCEIRFLSRFLTSWCCLCCFRGFRVSFLFVDLWF